MWLFVGGLLAFVSGLVPLVSPKYRKRTGGPLPLMFMSSPAVRRGFNRAQLWLYLSVSFLGLVGVFSVSRQPPWRVLAALAALGFLGTGLIFAAQVSFNWPKLLVPVEARDDEGSITSWFRSKTGRQHSNPGHADATGAIHRQGPGMGAAAPSEATYGPTAQIPRGEPGRVTFSRPKERAGRFASYKIWLDHQLVGRLRYGESLTVEATAGIHECRATVQWSGSPSIRLSVMPNQDVRVSVRHAALRPDETLIDQSVSRGGWLELVVEAG